MQKRPMILRSLQILATPYFNRRLRKPLSYWTRELKLKDEPPLLSPECAPQFRGRGTGQKHIFLCNICTHTFICIYIYTRTYTHIHTHSFIYIYVYTLKYMYNFNKNPEQLYSWLSKRIKETGKRVQGS